MTVETMKNTEENVAINEQKKAEKTICLLVNTDV